MMNRKLRSGAIGLSLLLPAVLSAPAGAIASDADHVSAVEVNQALGHVPTDLVEDAAASSSSKDEAAIVENESTMLSVPRIASEGIDISLDATAISINLPGVEGAASATGLESGVIAYPSGKGFANAVVPLESGVQMLTTIDVSAAPESFAYQIGVPQGGAVSLADDGSAVITDADGAPLISTTVPWAIDANGAQVPTHYEVDGANLIQVVDHHSGDYSYPIVADPTYWWGGKTWVPANKVSVSQTASILYALIPGFVGPVALLNVGLGLCNQAGKGIWVYWTWAGHIWCTGP